MANRVLIRRAAVLGAAALLSVTAEARAEVPRPATIVSIETEGDEVARREVVGLAGLEVGDELTAASAREAVRSLYQSGRFRDVRIFAASVEGGLRVRIATDLRQTVRSLEVEGNDAMSRREVVRATGYLAGEPWRPEDREQMIEALGRAYDQRGYPSARIALDVAPVPDEPEEVVLRVSVEEGEPVRLADIALRGRLGLPEPVLREALGLGPGDVFDRVALEEGLVRMAELYRAEGYYQARIEVSRVAAVVSEGGAANVVVPLDSGDHFVVDFVGNRRIPDERLRALLRIEQETRLSRAVLDTLAARLRDQYRNLGFHHARVDWRVSRTGPGERRLAFRVRAGPRVEVRRIEIEGNRHFSDRYLRRQIVAFLQERLATDQLLGRVSEDELHEIGLGAAAREPWREGYRPRPSVRSRPARTYVESIYRDAMDHIRRLYEADGYLGATVEGPEVELRDRGRQMVVRIRVEEGPETVIRSITFGGNQALDDERLASAIRLGVDEPLDRYQAEQARRRILEAYRAQGYVYARVESEEYLAEDALSADLVYLVDEGDQVLVGSILIRGNDVTRRSLIRERLALAPGDVYTPAAAQSSERALTDLGIFSTVSVSLADRDRPEAVKDVLVEVVERRPQSLEARVGFSTADGPRVRLRYRYGNLFGYGLGLDLGGDVSYQLFFVGTPETFRLFVEDLPLVERLERLVVASLSLPHLPVIGRVVGARLDVSHERDNDPGFGVTRTGTAFALSARWRPYLAGQLQVGVEYSDITPVNALPFCSEWQPPVDEPAARPVPGADCIAFCDQLGEGRQFPEASPERGTNCVERSPRIERLSRQPEGSSWFLVTRALLSVDLRDNPFNPTRGFFGSLSGEHVYTLRPVEAEDPSGARVELRSNLIRFTALANGYVPLGFLDWVLALSVRFGWIFELTRETTTFADRYFYLGGFDAMRGWAEESVPAEDAVGPGGQSMILLRAELRIPLPSSFALGVFVDAGDIWRQQTNLVEDFALRLSVGVGVRYNTPVGPLALDLGWRVPRPSELAALAALDDPQERTDRRAAFATPQVHFSIGLF